MVLYAHTDPDHSDPEVWQALDEHLREVGRLASGFASRFGMGEWGHVMGILHDAGKASDAFQRRLMGDPQKVDHATAGAKEAVARYGASGMLMAYAIVGHHGGLPNGMGASDIGGASSRTPLCERLLQDIEPYPGFSDMVDSGCLALPAQEELPRPLVPGRVHGIDDPETPNHFSFFVLARMLYSCLVDADALDAERIMLPEAARARSACDHASLDELLQKLLSHIDAMDVQDTPVNRARTAVLDDCLGAAGSPQGLFALTVPTGGGKTFSALAFALKHAIANDMSRVIVVAPFTTIISQTAARLREVFGDGNVLEHHSNYDLGSEGAGGYAQRLTAQNWDAPIVVTTNVQFLESLFTNKPGKSRKVHNIANSVVILDEAQTLPDPLLTPSLAMLEELTFAYNTSIILCSATQPALEMRWPYGSEPSDIVTRADELSEAFGSRVRYTMRGEVEAEELARDLAAHRQVLCIVGTKGNALSVYLATVEEAARSQIVDGREHACADGIFHLSAFMTPAHRDRIIREVKRRLGDNERCIVISTQLIEAGVDIDFPVVYREIAGMDSIVQAAGRCNREGASDPGSVYIFDLLRNGARGGTSPWLDMLRGISDDLIRENDDTMDEMLVKPFFERRYQNESVDAKGIFEILSRADIVKEGFENIPFERVASDYRIIEDDTVPLLVPFDEESCAILQELRLAEDPARIAMRAQRHCVSIPRWLLLEYQKIGATETVGPFAILREDAVALLYRSDIGLLKPGEEAPELLFI